MGVTYLQRSIETGYRRYRRHLPGSVRVTKEARDKPLKESFLKMTEQLLKASKKAGGKNKRDS